MTDGSMPAGSRLVGSDTLVPLVTGGSRRYVDLDIAASAPALRPVAEAVAELLPWYSSVHRGAGFKSIVSTRALETARESVHAFLNAPCEHTLIFTRNTTDSINLLASALPPDALVLTFDGEHHANLLPWRRRTVRHLPCPATPDLVAPVLERRLSAERAVDGHRPILVAVTGASNVTGEIWPLEQVVDVAHSWGARVFVDAAQVAPHLPLDLAALGADYLALSGHKLYAPFGAGVLVGLRDWLQEREPYLLGGGAVEFVTTHDVLWKGLPERQEAGSPNVIGAVAVAAACEALSAIGMNRVAEEEALLVETAKERLARVPGLATYSLWGGSRPQIGVMTFNLQGLDHGLLATVLSAEHGIGVRDGCFCAHPLVLRLLRVPMAAAAGYRERLRAGQRVHMPGAVRISFGLDTTLEDVALLADALERIATEGPRWAYRSDDATGRWVPDPDDRVWPELPVAMETRGAA
jgi:selenocysteine lyase/cysteine desulfurase